ncbi:MAG: hypothetical protein DHS20C21_15230 [Gemmatimonadota bacterium]|nr:MAG: hypothetical protein DHS20C21_15230 [Gemmatimonadota bacterium]
MIANRGPGAVAVGFGVTIFLSSLLLFQIQPIVSKHILPWYGGSPAVWTTCLLFFQLVLFAGYGYSHLLVRRVSPRTQALIHGTLIVAAMLPALLPGPAWAPQGIESPLPRILRMLLVTVGLPYFVLSATSPLLQSWIHRVAPDRPPWHLFATSNAGSLIALASYPFLVEPLLSLPEQARNWKWGFLAFAMFCGALLWQVARQGAASRAPAEPETRPGAPAGRTGGPALWVGWSATSVVLFMAVTNQLSLNIASIPFVWVMPLGIYLLSFIVTFSGHRGYPRRLFAFLLVFAVVAFYLALPGDIQPDLAVLQLGSLQRIALAGLALFVCCMVCHGELYRSRPPAADLTRFYLSVSLGGVVGGVLVGVVAPLVFLLYHELQLGLVACGVLYAISVRRDSAGLFPEPRRNAVTALIASALAVMVTASVVLTVDQLQDTVYTKRNFFGLIRVQDVGRDDPTQDRHLDLAHGTTLHGLQFLGDKARRIPTIYYGPISGVGLTLRSVERPGGREVGVIGMGAATLAAYGRTGDRIRFYEIDPDMEEVARHPFTFLEDSEATCDVVIGDGRLSLERDPESRFDVLVLDAFSSDAIPTHLLTVEAMEIYSAHLNPEGVFAFHISNHYLNLAPIVAGLAQRQGYRAIEVANLDEPDGATREATWMLLSRSDLFFERLEAISRPLRTAGLVAIREATPEQYPEIRIWTDDYSNLLQILR